MMIRSRPQTAACALLFLVLFAPWLSWAACLDPVARLDVVEGTASVRPASSTTWGKAVSGSGLCLGDVVRVARNSRAAINYFGADTLFRLDQGTTVRIVPPTGDAETGLDLVSGIANFISRVKQRLSITTPFMNAQVEGTEFLVGVDDAQTSLHLFEGRVVVANPQGTLTLNTRQSAVARPGAAPTLTRLLEPMDAIQWMLHYEPMLAALLASDGLAEALRARFEEALSELRAGDAAAAFDRIRSPGKQPNAAFYDLRAAMYLTVGRADRAQDDLAASERLAPGNGDAAAIAAIIALARNDRSQARALAEKATSQAPGHSLPWFALSYVRQADFDLPGAAAAIAEAVRVDPGNAAMRARLAELLLAQREFARASREAGEAARLDPDNVLVVRTRGFVELLEIDLASAERSFESALRLDPADPLARLGLGLTLIRGGDLEHGRHQFELAVALSPRNSLLRSYLGKAYFDEKRDALSHKTLRIAQGLDDKDPTPWLYEALLLRRENQPIKALDVLDASIARNDNRALFRTPALLDADEAARVATQGAIYRDLSFERLAVLQGWRAAGIAPDDQAGHRLLADAYRNQPRHEEARVSEEMLSLLSQPPSRTPIQPLTGETRLIVPLGMTPSLAGLNEYGPLFNRNGAAAWVTVAGGLHESLGDEILFTALQGKTAVSLSQYRYQTDGTGGILPQEQDILVAFAQHQLDPTTGLQVEARYSDLEQGPYTNETGASRFDHPRTTSLRLGSTIRWRPGSTTLFSLIWRQDDVTRTVDGLLSPGDPHSPLGDLDVEDRSEGLSGEVRHDWRNDRVTLTGGLQAFSHDFEKDDRLRLQFPLAPFVSFVSDRTENGRIEADFLQAYLYSSWRLVQRLSLDLGASYSVSDERRRTTTQETSSQIIFNENDLIETITTHEEKNRKHYRLNPKLGLVWRPTDGTSLRAGAMRTTLRPVSVKRTLEPTQVAGFNQYFDGLSGEDFWRYAVGLDQRISSGLYTGFELSRRDRTVPLAVFDGEDTFFVRNEKIAQGYVYWTPTSQLAAAAEYIYEESVYDRSTDADDKTRRLPLTLSYFHPGGAFAKLRGTYVEQSGIWQHATPREHQAFWNLDLALGYRLPERRGLISLQINNLLDRRFEYRETDSRHPLFVGELTATLRATLQF